MFLKIAKECTAKEGATQQDLDDLIARKSAPGKGGKCIKACLAETVGMVCDDDECVWCSFDNFFDFIDSR